MRIIQATWNLAQELVIWGESTSRSEETSAIASVSPCTPGETPRAHPFACTTEQLEEELSRFELQSDFKKVVSLLLPSDQLGPLPSPRNFPALEQERLGQVRLCPWQCPAVVLKPLNALYFLTSLPGETQGNLRYDDSVSYWLEATKFALELLTRGRFIPGLSAEAGVFRSYWHAVTNKREDTERMQVLVESMPALSRSLMIDNETDEIDPSRLLESFLASATDCLIRHFLTRHPILEASIDTVAHDTSLCWIQSLSQVENSVKAPIIELAKLETRLRSWCETLIPLSDTKIRLFFRLHPPELLPDLGSEGGEQMIVPHGSWRVEFLIGTSHDVRQLLPAARFWAGDQCFFRAFQYRREEVDEALLGELGRAANTFPQINDALLENHPCEVRLDTSEAYHFLRHTAPVLEASGFGVIFPSWWTKPSSTFGLHLHISAAEQPSSSTETPSLLGLNSLLDFSWEISLGDARLKVEDFSKLTASKSPLVLHHGEWVVLDPKDVEAAVEFLKTQTPDSRIRLIDAMRLGLGYESAPAGLPLRGFSASGWIQRLLEAKPSRFEQLTPPRDFRGSLRPYQIEGLSWLFFLQQVGCGACLADDMGLGKTIQLLALLLLEREEKALDWPIRPTLLISPMSIITNWEQETHRFAPSLSVYVHHGPDRLSGESFLKRVSNSDLLITTYSLAFRDEALLSQISWGRIALDEAQNIKNLATKQTQSIRRLMLKQLDRLGEACSRVALTGTPLENRLDELWSIIDFLNPGYFGSLHEFRSRFVVPIERYQNKDAAERLATVVRPFILRRLKTDRTVISDLPEKIEMVVPTSITAEQAALYQAVLQNMLPAVDRATGMHRKGLVLATITKLKQICNHPALLLKDNSPLSGRSGKLTLLEELLEVILAEGDRVLIFSQYAQMGHLLKPHLQELFGEDVLFLHGGLGKHGRQMLIERFQGERGPRIFILSLKAGGYGLNLTAANQIIHFDQWWNPAVEEQATDRAFRIGQTRNVQVRKLICRGTLEEKIANLVDQKRGLAESVVGTTKRMLTELSTDELKQILELSQTGVAND